MLPDLDGPGEISSILLFPTIFRLLSVSLVNATLLLPGRRPMRRVAAHVLLPESTPPLNCCLLRPGTGYGDYIEVGEGEKEIGMGRSVDCGEKLFLFFADVLVNFGEQLYTGEELFLFCICLYRSFLNLVLGEERKSEFITVLCKVLLGRLKSTLLLLISVK